MEVTDQTKQNSTTMMPPTSAKIVTFQLMEGITKSDFVEAAKQTINLCKEFPGFVARWLTVDNDGVTWTDYVVWTDRESGLRAAEGITQDPQFATFGNAIDMWTLVMKHSEIVM
jgi:hypothetical protein